MEHASVYKIARPGKVEVLAPIVPVMSIGYSYLHPVIFLLPLRTRCAKTSAGEKRQNVPDGISMPTKRNLTIGPRDSTALIVVVLSSPAVLSRCATRYSEDQRLMALLIKID